MSDHDPRGPGPTDPWSPPPPPPPPSGHDQPPTYPPQAPPYGHAPPYGQQPPYGQAQPYGYQPYMAPQTEGSAVGALVASILAWMFCPVIPAIVALVMIPGAKRKIDASGGRLTGDGLLTAAKWLSWINVVFYGLIALLVIGLIIVGILAEGGNSSDFSLGG